MTFNDPREPCSNGLVIWHGWSNMRHAVNLVIFACFKFSQISDFATFRKFRILDFSFFFTSAIIKIFSQNSSFIYPPRENGEK